jgi:hypothetical protein
MTAINDDQQQWGNGDGDFNGNGNGNSDCVRMATAQGWQRCEDDYQ